MNDLRNFNVILRKNLTYDSIKGQEKPGLHPLSRRYIFGKTTGTFLSHLKVRFSTCFKPSSHSSHSYQKLLITKLFGVSFKNKINVLYSVYQEPKI